MREIPYETLFELNPSDDTLKSLKEFFDLKTSPNLKGKKARNLYWEELLDDLLLGNYYLLLRALKTIPRRYGPMGRSKALQEKILPRLPLKNNAVVDKLLRRWPSLLDKRLTEEIIAYVYRMNPETLNFIGLKCYKGEGS